MAMAAAEQEGGSVPDLYQLLGVPSGASAEEITRAWRQGAAGEHPDRRPCDAAALARFHALAEAYQVLSDPARRAAYDRSRGNRPGRPRAAAPAGPAAGVPGRRPGGSSVPVVVRRAGQVPEPPLWAGPVRVEVPGAAPAAGPPQAEGDVARLVMLAELAVRYLADDWGWPW